MDANKISDVLNSLLSTSKKSILIDGTWGIGKTYQIHEFIKDNKKNKKVKIMYLSLFGMKTIDEVHTRLYSQLHPKANLVSKSISILTPAVSLIPRGGEYIEKGLEYVLNIINDETDSHSEIKKTKKQILIIFDDLERVDDDFKFITFLGYINQLFLSGIKVAVICNSKEILNDKEGFVNFKEKVFDREYFIEKAQEKIINSFFENNELDDHIISIFNNNLRIAAKSSLFFNEIKSNIGKWSLQNDYKTISNKTLIWYSSLIVSRFNSDFDSSIYKDRMNKDLNFINWRIKEYFNNPKTCEILECIYYFDVDSSYEFSWGMYSYSKQNVVELLCSLTFAYYFDDYSKLKDLLIVKEKPVSKSIFDNIGIFFLSEKDKIIYISKVISEINEKTECLKVNELEAVFSIFQYQNLFPTNYDEDKFILNLAKRLCITDSTIVNNIYMRRDCQPELKVIVTKLTENIDNLRIEEIKKRMESFLLNKKTDLLDEILKDLREKTYFHIGNEGLKKEIEDLLYQYDLFLPSLEGTISEESWYISSLIINFMKDFTNNERLKLYLNNKLVTSKTSEGKERFLILVNKLPAQQN